MVLHRCWLKYSKCQKKHDVLSSAAKTKNDQLWRKTKLFVESSAKSETTSFFDLRTSETVWPEPRGCQGPASRISFYK